MLPDSADPNPTLSLVVLCWNNLELTRRCVGSLSANTDVAFELVIVDNGSTDGTAEYAHAAADVAVVNQSNLGFARGMNSGLAAASGDYVAFVNNDTVFPPGWAGPLLDAFETHPTAGIVLPAVTAAGNPVTVRDQPGEDVLVLTPFAELPSGVVYVMRREVVTAVGGWNEQYKVASAEDLDLAFTVWAHGLDIVLCEEVLVEHLSQATVKHLPDRKELYRANLSQFLDKWEHKPLAVPLLDSTDQAVLDSRQEQARTAIIWIRRMLAARAESDASREAGEAGGARPGRGKGWFRSRS